jgi:hypothetical protein
MWRPASVLLYRLFLHHLAHASVFVVCNDFLDFCMKIVAVFSPVRLQTGTWPGSADWTTGRDFRLLPNTYSVMFTYKHFPSYLKCQEWIVESLALFARLIVER